MTDSDSARRETFRIALEHSWAWYQLRFGQFLQLLNFTLLSFAIISAAYVGALNARLDAIACGVAFLGSGIAIGVMAAGRSIQRMADVANSPLEQLQDRLANDTGIPTLRMFAEIRRFDRSWRDNRRLVIVACGLVSAAWIAAGIYPIAFR